MFIHTTPPPTTHPLSLHDALPICRAHGGNDDRGLETIRSCNRRRGRLRGTDGRRRNRLSEPRTCVAWGYPARERTCGDRKSTRLNSSHLGISYAVFCLKKKT